MISRLWWKDCLQYLSYLAFRKLWYFHGMLQSRMEFLLCLQEKVAEQASNQATVFNSKKQSWTIESMCWSSNQYKQLCMHFFLIILWFLSPFICFFWVASHWIFRKFLSYWFAPSFTTPLFLCLPAPPPRCLSHPRDIALLLLYFRVPKPWVSLSH